MNILSAIYNGQSGFLKAAERMAKHSERIAQMSSNSETVETLAEDLVGEKLEAITAKANLNSARIADSLLGELVQNTIKRKD